MEGRDSVREQQVGPSSFAYLDGRALIVFVVILVAGIVLWEIAVRSHVVSPLVPSPGRVLSRAGAILRDPFYVKGPSNVGIGWQLVASFLRVVLGFGLAAVIAIPLGFVLGNTSWLERAIDPFLQLLRPVSPLAWLPIGLAVLQDSQQTAIFVIFISSIWPMLFNTILGVRAVPAEYRALAATLKADRLTVLRRILLPADLPSLLTGVRLSLGIAWFVIVAAEMLVGGRGIGYFIWNNWNNLDVSAIGVAILLIGLIGLALDRAIRQLERLVAYD